MRTLLASLVAAAALTASVSQADACSIRGKYCGYPLWAANAFEGPSGSVNPNSGPILPQVPTYGYGNGADTRPAPRAARRNDH